MLAAAVGGAAAWAKTEIVAVGGSLAPIALEDQHGQPGAVDAGTRAVLLTRDMDAGGFVREALATDGVAKLERAGAVYVADVHRMPGPIRRLISLPRMRERPYRVLLDTDGGPTSVLPSEEGKATWLRSTASGSSRSDSCLPPRMWARRWPARFPRGTREKFPRP